jgi:hypothetical protein
MEQAWTFGGRDGILAPENSKNVRGLPRAAEKHQG